MLYAGIDVGAQSVKAVIFDGKKIIGQKLHMTEEEADTAARKVYGELLQELNVSHKQVSRIFATGRGASNVSLAGKRSSEQVCAGRGSHWLFPSARTVVDIGAEGCRVIRLKLDGIMEDFANNAKCASGTGALIELGALYLKVPIEEMGPLSLAADEIAEVSSTCAVFAESEIISNIHRGVSRERMAAGIHWACATRIVELLGRLGLVEDVVIVGGAALNVGLVKVLVEMTGISFLVPDHPRTVTALGAAIQAFTKGTERYTDSG